MGNSVKSLFDTAEQAPKVDACLDKTVGYFQEIMERETQISALGSRTTKKPLDRHVRATGVKKGHLVEQALRHHLQALQELPADLVIHPKLVVTRKSGNAILKQIKHGPPSVALRKLMRNGG